MVGEEDMVGSDWVCGVSRHLRDGEQWYSTDLLVGLAQLDQNLKAWRSHEDVLPAGVPTSVELGSRCCMVASGSTA